MRTNTLSIFAIIIVLTACTSRDEQQLHAAQALVKEQLRDPDSAQFDCKWQHGELSGSQKERYALGQRILECDVRSKNGFGGYGNTLFFDFVFYTADSRETEVQSAYYFDSEVGFAGRRVKIK